MARNPVSGRVAVSGRNAIVTQQNLFRDSNDLTTVSWSTDAAATVTQVAGITLPDGTTGTVTRLSGNAGLQRYARNSGYYPFTTGGQYTMSAWVKTVAGDTETARLTLAAAGVSVGPNETVTGAWKRLTFTGTLANGNVISFIGNGSGNNVIDVYIYNVQITRGNNPGPDCVTGGSNYDVGNLCNLVPTAQNLFLISEPQALSDIYSKHNVTVDAFSWPDKIVTPYCVSVGTSLRYVYMYFSSPNNVDTYTFDIIVIMDDNSMPIVSTNSAPSDFQLVFCNSSQPTAAVTSIGNNLYRISYTGVATSALYYFGIVKYVGHSSKTFKVSGWHISRTSYVSPYKKTHGAAYNIGDLRNTI